MGHSVKASLWCDNGQLLSASDVTLRQSFQTTQGDYQVIIILPIKSKMAAAKKQCFLRFLY